MTSNADSRGGRAWKALAVLTVPVLLLAGWAAFQFVLTRPSTPGITGPGGEPLPDAVASLETVELGGVEQWILVRGRDRRDPVLLFLHGGPGMPAMYLAHDFQRSLESDFVVVHWDRRGAGKSYDAGRDSTGLTVSRTLADTRELTRLLMRRFDEDRIYLVGHSWGSYLGMLAVREHPALYAAFVGTGQMAADTARVRAVQRRFVAGAARRAGDSAVLKRVRRSGVVTEDDLFRYGGELHGETSFWPILLTGLRAPEYELSDVWNVRRGADRVDRLMEYDVIGEAPLDRKVLEVEVPVFFFLGRHDRNTPSSLAAAYLERLEAPLKDVVWFEASAHFPFWSEPERFHREMVRVRERVEAYRGAGGSAGMPPERGARPARHAHFPLVP